MPLYEYKCNSCEANKEVLQKFDDPPPRCSVGTQDMVKKVSVTSFSLKGDGWAKDNYGLTEAS